MVKHVLKLSEADARAHLQSLEQSYRSASTELEASQQTHRYTQENNTAVEGASFTAEDAEILCSTMYPKPYTQFRERIEKYSDLLWLMPSSVYCKGTHSGRELLVLV